MNQYEIIWNHIEDMNLWQLQCMPYWDWLVSFDRGACWSPRPALGSWPACPNPPDLSVSWPTTQTFSFFKRSEEPLSEMWVSNLRHQQEYSKNHLLLEKNMRFTTQKKIIVCSPSFLPNASNWRRLSWYDRCRRPAWKALTPIILISEMNQIQYNKIRLILFQMNPFLIISVPSQNLRLIGFRNCCSRFCRILSCWPWLECLQPPEFQLGIPMLGDGSIYQKQNMLLFHFWRSLSKKNTIGTFNHKNQQKELVSKSSRLYRGTRQSIPRGSNNSCSGRGLSESIRKTRLVNTWRAAGENNPAV